MSWLAANVPIYAVNVLLSTATDMWALRYPEPNELYLLDRAQAGQITAASICGPSESTRGPTSAT